MTDGSKGHEKRVIEDEMTEARFGKRAAMKGEPGDVRHLRPLSCYAYCECSQHLRVRMHLRLRGQLCGIVTRRQ